MLKQFYKDKINFMFLVMLILSVYSVFHIKYKLYKIQQDIVEVGRQIDEEENAVVVLRAEWAYLNTPKRLAEIATKFIGMNLTAGHGKLGQTGQQKRNSPGITNGDDQMVIQSLVGATTDNTEQLMQISQKK